MKQGTPEYYRGSNKARREGYMNKKDIAEIKKKISTEGLVITRIRGCLIDNVDNDKNVKTLQKIDFVNLSDTDAVKYEDIFAKTLSGTIGKNLINLEFPLDEEKAGGKQEFLDSLVKSELRDDGLVDEFFDRVKANYAFDMSYYVILMHGVYDVPGKADDGEEMFDASDTVFNFVLCSICPMELTKSALTFDSMNDIVTSRLCDLIVSKPAHGFMYPAFEDRGPNVHSALYFSKNAEKLQPALINAIIGSESPLSAKGQKEAFDTLVKETLGDDCDYDHVISVNETLTHVVAQSKKEEGPMLLGKEDVKAILSRSGLAPEHFTNFDENAENVMQGNGVVSSANIANTKKMKIETPSVAITVAPDRAAIIEKKQIDGKNYLLIPIDGQITINGIEVD